MTVVLISVAIGLVASAGLSRALGSLLYEVSPLDPGTFAGVAALMLLVALAGCYVPARRATRVDPLSALRAE